MTKLSENSLVKKFGKNAPVFVEVSGDKDGIYSRQTEKQTDNQQIVTSIVREQRIAQREASFER